jgi:hypothetical protein
MLSEKAVQKDIVVSRLETTEEKKVDTSHEAVGLMAATDSADAALQSKVTTPSRKNIPSSASNDRRKKESLSPPETASMKEEESSRESVENADAAQPDTSREADQSLQGRSAGITVKPSAARKQEMPEPASSELQEVVVTGYGATKRRENDAEARKNMGSTRFAPADGWQAFHRYINENKRLTSSGENKVEQLTFMINENGRPVNIRIVQSISREHDVEALRLLNQGPSWKVLRGRNRKVILEIVF